MEPPLSRDMPCVSCGHACHVLHCGADLGYGVFCPCRVPVPGVYPD